MKKSAVVAIALCMAILFAGCSKIPLKQRSIVEGIAVDWEDGEYQITVQCYKATEGMSGQRQYQFHWATGLTLFDALENVVSKTGKKPFYANCQVIVFSYDVLSRGMQNLLDCFIRDNEIRPNCYICCTRKKAQTLFSVNGEGEYIPAQRIASIIEAEAQNEIPKQAELMNVAGRYLSDCEDTYLPILDLEENQTESTARIAGVACFKGKNHICQLTGEEYTGFLLINGCGIPSALNVNSQNTFYSLKSEDIKAEKDCSIKEGVPEFSIDLSVKCVVKEVDGEGHNTDSQSMEQLQRATEEKIKNVTALAIERALIENGCDVFGLNKVLKRRFPEYYKGVENFSDILSKERVIVNPKVVVQRVGQLN